VIESSNGLFLLLILSRDCKFAVTNDYNWCHKLIFVSWGVFFVKISICREESIEERGGGGIGGDQEMDYSLAALKLLRVQDTSETPSQNALTLGGILFQRAWLQVPPLLFLPVLHFTPPPCNSFLLLFSREFWSPTTVTAVSFSMTALVSSSFAFLATSVSVTGTQVRTPFPFLFIFSFGTF
jgi:hypothetical protein